MFLSETLSYYVNVSFRYQHLIKKTQQRFIQNCPSREQFVYRSLYMGTIGEAPEVSRGPTWYLLGIGIGGHTRVLYIVPEVNGGLYMAPEVRELLGCGPPPILVLVCGGHLWCRIKGYLPAVPFMY